MLSSLEELLKVIPVYLLHNRPDREAVAILRAQAERL